MGITLKQCCFILIISSCLLSCKSKNTQRINYSESSEKFNNTFFKEMEETLTKEQWISDFKKIAYYNLLKLGYKNDPTLLHELFEVVDISHYDPYYGSIYIASLENIETHMKKVYEQIIQDSVSNRSWGSIDKPGKKVLDKALDFYTSKLLDSLANEEYKKWRKLPQAKRDSIYGLIVG